MGVWEDLNWFAIQTKPSREEVAISYLSRLRLEVFCPKTKQNLLLSGRSGLVARPLFPGYLFARFCPASCLRLVQYARGVRRVVSAQDCPLPVDQEIISLIRERVSSGGSIERCAQEFHSGEKVIVRCGALEGLLGVFERELGDRERVVVLLDAIYFQARVLVEKGHLQAAAGQAN
jgi:transcriptional antiterminator RfaH